MDSLSKHWEKTQVQEHLRNLTVSPSSLKDMERCEIKGALIQTSGGHGIDKSHARFGSAFGLACAHIAIYCSSEDHPEMGRALAYAATQYGYLEKIRDKTWTTLVKAILAFASLWFRKYYPKGWRGIATETRLELQVDSVRIAGAYDLKAMNIHTGYCRIYDFKAVESEFMYKWETNTQILHYTFLDYAVNNARLDAQGCYLVALITEHGVDLYERQPRHTLYKRFRQYIADAYRKGVALQDPETLTAAPGGWACDGRSQCKFIQSCYGDKDVEVKLHVDDRKFPSVFSRPVDYRLLMQLADSFVAELNSHLPSLQAETELEEQAYALMDADFKDDADEVSITKHLLRED